MPPTFFYAFIGLSIVFHTLIPIKQVIFPLWTYLGMIPIIFGIIIDVWADLLFKKHKTTENPYKKPSSLVNSGPFKISRHPMYLGMTLILLGISIILGSLIAFVFPFVFFLIMEFVYILYEEKNMEKIFKKQYKIYKKNVRKWI